ncbi:MAG: hypothetical protein PHG05_02015 [Candidatus Nanoarchaeia archaeon]|nr:hypothetical protein [Candidatus Nanoarchaeia archaeon]
MKRGIYFLALVLALNFVLAYNVTLSGSDIDKTDEINQDQASFVATLLKYEPYPLTAGESFEAWLNLKNLGESDSGKVEVEFTGTAPFKIYGQNPVTISDIPEGAEAVFKFERIMIDSDLIEGTYDLKFKIYTRGNKKEFQTIRVPVEIRTLVPIIDIKAYSDPEYLEQGAKGRVVIELSNMESSIMKEVNIDLILPSEFIPLGSTTEKKIPVLKAGEKAYLFFDVIPSSDAVSKAYSVPFTLTFFDESGENHTKTDSFGLLVQKPISYELNLEESDNFIRGKTGKVVLSISNIGPTEIKYMTMEILPSEEYEVIGNSKTYLGNLEADDFESGQFTVNAQKSKEINLRVQLKYKDGFNKDYSEIKEIPLRIYSNSELKAYGLNGGGGNSIVSLIFIIIIILLVYWTYKAWREVKDLGKAVKIAFKKLLKGILNIISKLRWSYIKRIPRRIKLFIQSQ